MPYVVRDKNGSVVSIIANPADGSSERLDASVPGSGLGLAIVQEIAEAYGGSIALDRAALGGLAVRLQLPLAGEQG